MPGQSVVVLVAHGTVEDIEDLPAFVTEIRRGRPPTPELLSELRHRYETIGGSPLLVDTRRLAAELQTACGYEVRVAMRLWKPKLREVVADLGPEDRVLLVPLAPFSVSVYREAALRELSPLGDGSPRLDCVEPWGLEPSLVEGWCETITAALARVGPEADVIVTAHSLPMVVLRSGDPYAQEFESAVRAVEARLGRTVALAYQSQGAMEGEWLGPRVEEILETRFGAGQRRFVVAPLGFLSEHVETLYDLDIELRGLVERLGGELARAGTVASTTGLGRTLLRLVDKAWGTGGATREN